MNQYLENASHMLIALILFYWCDLGSPILQINDHCWCPRYCSTDNTAAQNAPCWSSILDGKICFGTQEGWQ